MKVLIVEPGYSPYEADIENTPASLTAVLESEQYTAAFPFDNTVIAAVYGGDAEKPYNRTLGSICFTTRTRALYRERCTQRCCMPMCRRWAKWMLRASLKNNGPHI